MIRKFLFCVMMLVASIATVSAQEVIDNAKVLELLKSGWKWEQIARQVELDNHGQHLSMDSNFINELMKLGANDTLIMTLQQFAIENKEGASSAENTNIVDEVGVCYVDKDNGGRLEKIDINTFKVEEKKTLGIGTLGGIAGALGTFVGYNKGGLDGLKTIIKAHQIMNMAGTLGDTKFKSERLYLEQQKANTVISGTYASNPTFRFYFPEITNYNTDNSWFYKTIGTIKNPNDFICVKLTPNVKKNKRSFPSKLKLSILSEQNDVSLNSNSNDLVHFSAKPIGENTYEITFPNGLEPGEYCFYYKNYKNELLQNHLIAFDFRIE